MRGWRGKREGGGEGVGHIETHWDTSRGLQHMCEVVAGAGAHEGYMGCVCDGGGTLRRSRVCQRGQGTSRGMGCVLGGHGAMARAGVCEGCIGHVWDGSGALRRGGMHQNTSGCIKGGHGACVRSWLGLGHMKGVWDASRMVAAH